MSNDFHERFNIPVDLANEQKRFVNAIITIIRADKLSAWVDGRATKFPSSKVIEELAIHFCKPFAHKYNVVDYIPKSFRECLEAVEVIYRTCYVQNQRLLAEWIKRLLRDSRVDLSVRFKDGKFYPEGSELLDKKLVNDVLNCISPPEYASILEPFSRGLQGYMESNQDKDRLKDVIGDMYEASEAFARVKLENSKDLSANKEQLIKVLRLNDHYKKIYSEYIEYACAFRHAVREKSPRPELKQYEVEAFMYLTGLLIRLGIKG